MSLFRKSDWTKFIVHCAGLDWADLTLHAYVLADALADKIRPAPPPTAQAPCRSTGLIPGLCSWSTRGRASSFTGVTTMR